MSASKESHLSIEDFRFSFHDTDRLYNNIIRKSGLSDAEFWSLLLICTGKCSYQHEICEQLFLSKQTVHSAVKQLIKKGFVCLKPVLENQRLKKLLPTGAGKAFYHQQVKCVLTLEERAWNAMTSEEQALLLQLNNRYNRLLETEIRQHFS